MEIKYRAFIPQQLRPKVQGSNISISLDNQGLNGREIIDSLTIEDIKDLASRTRIISKILKNSDMFFENQEARLINILKSIR